MVKLSTVIRLVYSPGPNYPDEQSGFTSGKERFHLLNGREAEDLAGAVSGWNGTASLKSTATGCAD